MSFIKLMYRPVFNLGHPTTLAFLIKTTTLLKFKAFRNVIHLSNKEKKIDQHAGSHSKKHVAAEQIRKAFCSRLGFISKSLRGV